MYEKNAYKYMNKKRIQMYEKNKHTNTHTNVLKKPAYKHAYQCIKKTRIQTRIQIYEKNLHTNV